MSSNYPSGKTTSWLGTDLRNLNGSLHHFDFTNLDPTIADININFRGHDYDDIYSKIGEKLDYLFLGEEEWFNISSFYNHMTIYTLGEKFLILNHDCAFSNSKEDPRTGEHWKVTDQRWKVPTTKDIPENYYYCYNLQLVNLYNHTSLTFACNICNFPTNVPYTPHFKIDHGSYDGANGYILPNHVTNFGIHNLNTHSISYKMRRRAIEFFVEHFSVSFNYYFCYTSPYNTNFGDFGDGYRWTTSGRYTDDYFCSYEDISLLANIHFSSDDRLWAGHDGFFDRSKVNNLIWSKRISYRNCRLKYFKRTCWKVYFECALFSGLYLTDWGEFAWSIAGGAWKSTTRFPYSYNSEGFPYSSTKWKVDVSITDVKFFPTFKGFVDDKKDISGFPVRGLTDYSDFLYLERKPDYILTSENELYWFYRSSVTFNFFNTHMLDQVILKKTNEGLGQVLDLNNQYILKKGCYQFLLTFHVSQYPYNYYGYKVTKTMILNIHIIPDYDFSLGLNAVTLHTTGFNSNYTYTDYPIIFKYSWQVIVDIYFEKKIIRKFCEWLRHSFLVTESMLSFFNKPIFKNMCSFDELHLKDSINHFQDNSLYQFLDNQMTHKHDDDYLGALKNSIKFYWKNNSHYNAGHLHFVLKKDLRKKVWNLLNGGKENIDHFYDKIVQPNQWK